MQHSCSCVIRRGLFRREDKITIMNIPTPTLFSCIIIERILESEIERMGINDSMRVELKRALDEIKHYIFLLRLFETEEDRQILIDQSTNI
jgi:hypothetical protein